MSNPSEWRHEDNEDEDFEDFENFEEVDDYDDIEDAPEEDGDDGGEPPGCLWTMMVATALWLAIAFAAFCFCAVFGMMLWCL